MLDLDTYGRHIVEDIINRYILSDEFEQDAIHHVYKMLFDKYNAKIADCGNYFEFNAFDGGGRLKPEVAEKFQTDMERLTKERDMFRKIFGECFGYNPEYKDTISIMHNLTVGKDKNKTVSQH